MPKINLLQEKVPLELWGGVECTVNRVGDRYHDQIELTGHARRIDDLERIAALGIRRLRYPVLWERVAPGGLDRADWAWTDSRLPELQALGIAPIAGLVHHGSGPVYSTILDGGFPERLADYAASVAQRYPWIDAYTPINEPLTTARFCALYGHWYPHEASDAAFVRAVLQQCRATALAMRAIRSVNSSAKLVQTDDAGKTFSTDRLAYQAEFENHRRWLACDLLSGRVNETHPLWAYLRAAGAAPHELGWFLENPCPPDVVGLNYYLTSDRFLDERLDRYPKAASGGNGRDTYADVEAVRARDAISGHRAVLQEAWNRFRLPVAVTEVHLGCTRDEQMRWLLEAWNAAHDARENGADVVAVTAWALFGLTDWDSLVTRLDGHYEPGAYDIRGPEPRATAIAGILADLAAGRAASHPALESCGWWRRAERVRIGERTATGFAAVSAGAQLRPRVRAGNPILIAGSRGTLGSAFVRICAERGLRIEALPHEHLDIADAASIGAAMNRVRPWAVINAAGYVRVDEAEHDEEESARANTLGPQLLAEACQRAGVRLVTFSSDLVFDGTAERPYIESDAAGPLSTYGRTKADAEVAVLAACPDALVVRTSAFFGPWDRWNVLHLALDALASGRPWKAAGDQRVSPTYVPDLVNACLDLLIDGAAGIWHLANAGDVSWAELVRKAASVAGYPPHLVQECTTAALGLPAARPAYSVLGTQRGQILPSLDDALARFLEERMRPLMRPSGASGDDEHDEPALAGSGPQRRGGAAA